MVASTLTLNPGQSIPRKGTSLGASITAAGSSLRDLFHRVPRLYLVIATSALAAALLAVVGVTQGSGLAGYASIFGLSILLNALLFVPAGRGAVLLAGAIVLNPLAVAILSGVGGALGEMTRYALGRSSGKLAARPRII